MCAVVHVFSLSREKVISVMVLMEFCQYWHWHGLACIVLLGGVGERGEEIYNWVIGFRDDCAAVVGYTG